MIERAVERRIQQVAQQRLTRSVPRAPQGRTTATSPQDHAEVRGERRRGGGLRSPLRAFLFFAGTAPDVMEPKGENWVKPGWHEVDIQAAEEELEKGIFFKDQVDH